MSVKNFFPTTLPLHRIAIVGDAPTTDDVHAGRPFQGSVGKFLYVLLKEAGIDFSSCFVGNICQSQPPKNDLSEFDWSGPEISSGLIALRDDLRNFQPNIIILLGPHALRAARGMELRNGKQKPPSISSWRGSVFMCDHPSSPMFGYKCIATYHPSYLFRCYSDSTYARFDIRRAKKHSITPELMVPQMNLDVDPKADIICRRLDVITQQRIKVSIDIEGYVDNMTCISVAPSIGESFIIPFTRRDGSNYWTESEEIQIWDKLIDMLSCPDVPKVLQNGMYDRFVLAYSYRTLVSNMEDDTMLKHWELYSELEKSLAVQTSLYTDHTYYKSERLTDDLYTYWRYCCKDSAITYEINEKLEQQIVGSSRSHYRFNMDLQNPFLYIELRGMRVDIAKRDTRIELLKNDWTVKQGILDAAVGKPVNVNSPLQMKWLLYEHLGLDPVFKRNAQGEESPTTNYEALLKLSHQFEGQNQILNLIVDVRSVRKRISILESLTTDPDGRIRSSTNIVGTNTGRTTSSVAPTGNGTNMQTVPSPDRDLIIADPDHDMAQCDLAGADGWTVAAHAAKHGDATMLEDYLAGLKPAKVLALMVLKGSEVNMLDRATLKKLSKDINADTDPQNGYIYFACKRIQHGSNYRMGPDKLALQIFLDSEGKIILTKSQAKKIQDLYFLRYPGVRKWQYWIEGELKMRGYLIGASGHKRLFFDRKDASQTINAGCAYEPQHNTTYVTNLALQRMWNDPENREGRALRVWPCHQVHDALNSQWHKTVRGFAVSKMRDWFNNPITVAGIRLTIPFEGAFGPSWGEKTDSIPSV